MLHHYFANGLGEKGCLTCRYCAGQNKNRSVSGYLAWRCMTGLHEEIQISFMVVGHTHCLVDRCFGLVKQKYRQSDCYTLEQQKIVEEESKVMYIAQLYKAPGSLALNFIGMTGCHFLMNSLPGNRSFQHFRFAH